MKNLSKLFFGIIISSLIFLTSFQSAHAQCMPNAIKGHWDPLLNGVYCNGSGDITCLFGCAPIR